MFCPTKTTFFHLQPFMEFRPFESTMRPIFDNIELIERDNFLSSLNSGFKEAASGEGYCFFIMGEAGIGKTSLVKAFLKKTEDECIQYIGACDSLFTPRPLGPLYDLALQINENWINEIHSVSSRAELFSRFVQELTQKSKPVIIVFEDIHWADEATLDFVKFLARRISRLRCLFILTLRDDEINLQYSLRNVFSDLAPDTFTRLVLTPLSKQAVQKLADEKGYDGEDVYSISGGNPFYVNEILASYSLGVPDSVKDSILCFYNRLEDETKNVLQFLSVIPEGLELTRLYKIDPSYHQAIESCLTNTILVIKNSKIFFKHELYRRTIEASLSPFKRIALNKSVLQFFLKSFEEKGEIEKIVHYAKNASENKLVVKYAPLAAKQAAAVGAHIEASKLFYTAIEYFEENDTDQLVKLYEDYAYECYLTNQLQDAIIYQGRALKVWEEKNEVERLGNSLRLFSRLWWFDGNRQKAEKYAAQAIEVLNKQPSSKAKAMAYSNMSQLNMLSDQTGECIFWGEKAIAIAREVNDEETLAHAMINMGSALMLTQSSAQKGIDLLKEGRAISLKNSYHEHAARAYTAMGSNLVTIKDYPYAKQTLEEGINYCEERDIDSLKLYMLGWKARLNLETGHWNEAFTIASNLLKKENLPPVIKIGALTVVATIKIRTGEQDALPLLLEAKKLAFVTTELQRVIPAMIAMLEYEWASGKRYIEREVLHETMNMFLHLEKISQKCRFFFWLDKMKEHYPEIREKCKTDLHSEKTPQEEADSWENLGCPYEQALSLFDGTEDNKRKALSIIQQLGADAIYEKLKMEMRSSGIKKIPRGLRGSTKANPAQLTNRELDVLQLLKKGIQNREIAEALFISPKTVDHHISSILFKLDVKSRSKAVTEAARLGIVK
jgi:DNA-binding CsgD family transcriptional regulator